MARIARIVVPGCWHHVTQRGNRKQIVFFEDIDRTMYLELLRGHCQKQSVALVGYCLMSNHVHLVAIPSVGTGLAKALGRTHNDYARWLNLRCGESGHLWQSRYFSCPLDERHQWEVLRYVELNPVRAGLVAKARDWRWSSAQAHTRGIDRTGLLHLTEWRARWTAETWSDVLEQGVDDAAFAERIRDSTHSGRPVGSADFVNQLEMDLKRPLRPQKRGPKSKILSASLQMELGVA